MQHSRISNGLPCMNSSLRLSGPRSTSASQMALRENLNKLASLLFTSVTTAQVLLRTSSEVRPVVIPYDHSLSLHERILEIPAFQGFGLGRTHSMGFPVPPGFPFTIRKSIDSDDWQRVKSGKAQLEALVRLSYMSEFGNNCHTLNLIYSTETGKFTLGSRPSVDYCGSQPQMARFETPVN
jgi:hypothetical protein